MTFLGQAKEAEYLPVHGASGAYRRLNGSFTVVRKR